MLKRIGCSLAALCLAGGLALTPAQAQSASEMALRMQQLEDQVRLLMGQVEELTFEVKQLKKQVAGAKAGAADPAETMSAKPKAIAEAPAAPQEAEIASQPLQPLQPLGQPSGAEQIVDNGQSDIGGGQALSKAPGPMILGSMNNSAAKADDGGFQGQILVAPSQQEAPAQPLQEAAQVPMTSQGTLGGGDSIEQVSLAPDAATATPETAETLYQQSYDFMMQRRFDDAQQGFNSIIQRYPDHDLVGPSYYWLGETYFAQSQYKQAAEQFLTVYKTYPKSSKAADSMVKLGVSLVKLGNAQQGCAVYDAVAGQFPKAAQAIKRAQLEAKRAGCGS
jgi:tol-pal system protein YbgF